MPILKLLYNADDHNAHHIYMSLIILLILSQDENFNKSVHELVRSPSCLVYSSYFRKMGYMFITSQSGILYTDRPRLEVEVKAF